MSSRSVPGADSSEMPTGRNSRRLLTRDSYATSPAGTVHSGPPRIGDRNNIGTPTGLKRVIASSRYRGEIFSIGKTTRPIFLPTSIMLFANQFLYTDRRRTASSRSVCMMSREIDLEVPNQLWHTSSEGNSSPYHCQRTGGLT
jgi:hypothetical protein